LSGGVLSLFHHERIFIMTTDVSVFDHARIAELNDRFRKGSDPIAASLGGVIITRGILALDLFERLEITEKVRTFDSFPEGDDPYGQHDFGAFDNRGKRIFWKIDYYDRASYGAGEEYGSDDPGDPAKTYRVLTVMLADEY
jgi:Protein of unknown function (DUF3768)